jgi:uncharacterized protein YcfJ
MKRTMLAAAVLAATPISSFAFDDVGRVISSTPIMTQVSTPTQHCYTETAAPQPQQHGYAGAILGGAAGGLLGAQFGKGKGKVAAAAAGAAVGAVAGDRIENREVGAQPAQRCETVNNVEMRVTGYTVVYKYAGREFTTTTPATMNYAPGTRLPLEVSVAPR